MPIISANLVGSVSISLNQGYLNANGYYSFDNGTSLSESIDLTSFMTTQSKSSVSALLGLIEQQYQIFRINTLTQDEAFLTSISAWSAIENSTLAASTAIAYAGTQSLDVHVPGQATNEGAMRSVTSLSPNHLVNVVLYALIPTNVTLSLILTDTANMNNTYSPVVPATNPVSYTYTSSAITSSSVSVVGNGMQSWQTLSAKLQLGITNTPNLTIQVVNIGKATADFYVGAIQVY